MRDARREEGFALLTVLRMTVLLVVLAFSLIDVMKAKRHAAAPP